MKLNKDNYELLMFDLLEGNLSEKDELLVMKQIEEDEFFFREWKLFKSTVLVADDDVVFAGKSSLLKDEAPVAVISMFKKWMAVAASVCILAAAVLLWPSSDVVGPVVDAEVEIPTTIDPVIETPEVQEEVVVADDLESKDDAEQFRKPKRIKDNNSIEQEYKAPQEVVVDIPLFKAKDNETPYLEKKELPKYDEILVKTVVVSNDNPKGEKEQEEDELKAENPENVIVKSGPLLIDNKTKSQKVIEFVTKTPPRRIKEKAIGIIALVSNPRIKFKPNFKGKKPSLEIELETTGYQAIASIQPFKNRN